MSYALKWTAAARGELTSIWLNSSERQDVTDAAREIEYALRHTPRKVGESRAGNRRVVIRSPVAVFYEIIEDDNLVRILHAKPLRKTGR